jgi:hypothetical protein
MISGQHHFSSSSRSSRLITLLQLSESVRINNGTTLGAHTNDLRASSMLQPALLLQKCVDSVYPQKY